MVLLAIRPAATPVSRPAAATAAVPTAAAPTTTASGRRGCEGGGGSCSGGEELGLKLGCGRELQALRRSGCEGLVRHVEDPTPATTAAAPPPGREKVLKVEATTEFKWEQVGAVRLGDSSSGLAVIEGVCCQVDQRL